MRSFFLFGFGIVSGLNINATDQGAYKEEKNEEARAAQYAKELKQALEGAEDTEEADSVGHGAIITDPRAYFIERRSDPQISGIAVYISEHGNEEYIIPTEQQRNTIPIDVNILIIRVFLE